MAQDLKEQIRARYGAAARSVSQGGGACCGPAPAAESIPLEMAAACCSPASTGGELPEVSCCGPSRSSPITTNLYLDDQVDTLPGAAVQASLGCGNPTALVELIPGETVLDLGSGGGIDVLLSARRVGPTGKAYGLDMTDEMLELARRNQREAGATNVEFLKGEIEAIPLPDNSVDVIISNCVINLSTDKDRVFAEAVRVLKPGGRFAVSDMIFRGDLSLIGPEQRHQVEAWAGCIAGALEEQDYLRRLAAAGFAHASIQVTRVYQEKLLSLYGGEAPDGIELVAGFVRARKPAAAAGAHGRTGGAAVRPASRTDLPAVRRLLREAGLTREGLEAQFGPRYTVAVSPAGQVVGAAGMEVYGEHGLLRSTVVDPVWQGHDLGAALIRSRLDWARSEGLRSIWLLTETASEYFLRFGFLPAARDEAPPQVEASAEFSGACPESAAAMRLSLR